CRIACRIYIHPLFLQFFAVSCAGSSRPENKQYADNDQDQRPDMATHFSFKHKFIYQEETANDHRNDPAKFTEALFETNQKSNCNNQHLPAKQPVRNGRSHASRESNSADDQQEYPGPYMTRPFLMFQSAVPSVPFSTVIVFYFIHLV